LFAVLFYAALLGSLPVNESGARRASRTEKSMRLKLVLLSSLIAAIVGVGSTTAIILLVFGAFKPTSAQGLLVLTTYLIPLVAILLAAIFVYRHTARRRRLQAILTALISLLLTFGILLLFSILSKPTLQQSPPPTQAPANVG
jgi:amino acid transporter